jgi:hypothetical protein
MLRTISLNTLLSKSFFFKWLCGPSKWFGVCQEVVVIIIPHVVIKSIYYSQDLKSTLHFWLPCYWLHFLFIYAYWLQSITCRDLQMGRRQQCHPIKKILSIRKDIVDLIECLRLHRSFVLLNPSVWHSVCITPVIIFLAVKWDPKRNKS